MGSPIASTERQTPSAGALDPASELQRAVADIGRGDFLALTPEQLDEWANTGEFGPLDEWLAESHD